MAMPVETAVCIAHNVFLLLDSWVWTCVLAADEAARLLRSASNYCLVVRALKLLPKKRLQRPALQMAMPRETAVSIAHNVFVLLDGWVWTCVLAADEAARLLRSATH
ncbi:hypothetical protein BAE44_0021487 [Dichanthelium oligosanthes]|uniref:Uncharacterized protein n=1 Tax=Dichanthelium oligosanthes TaxID=888268 RepID=A0A1E5UXG3_9POAL|nr:hypothetical protein BAE44_0021487 [Dichanthelium oligosanthes]